MHFSIVFNNSGDEIKFKAADAQRFEVLDYFVEQLNNNDINEHSYDPQCGKFHLIKAVRELKETLEDVNSFIEPYLGHLIEQRADDELVHYTYLNKLHADWVQSQSLPVNVSTVEGLANLCEDDVTTMPLSNALQQMHLGERYGNINTKLHAVEKAHRFLGSMPTSGQWIEFDNPFPKELVTNDAYGFSIRFGHLGRTQYNKFINSDYGMECDDENTFDQLLPMTAINLTTPETIPYSKEYLQWCKENNRTPSGIIIAIGNIVNFQDNLLKYRTLFYRNVIKNNAYKIIIN